MHNERRLGKRTLAIVIILALAFGAVPFTTAADYSGHWSSGYIESAQARGWMSGYEDGTFRPDNEITRAEFSVMLWRALGAPAVGGAVFSDVLPSQWYAEAVNALYSLEITSGIGGGLFDPGGTLTREMGCTMLARAFGLRGTGTVSFADSSEISDWAAQAVSALTQRGYITGMGDNLFAPKNPLTRGQMAKLLIEISDGENGAPDETPDEPGETPDEPNKPGSGGGGGGGGTVTVTFNADNGSAAATSSINSGSSVSKPTEPEKPGYIFMGWYQNGTGSDFSDEWNFTTAISADLTLKARWREDNYTIAYIETIAESSAGKVAVKFSLKDSGMTANSVKFLGGNYSVLPADGGGYVVVLDVAAIRDNAKYTADKEDFIFTYLIVTQAEKQSEVIDTQNSAAKIIFGDGTGTMTNVRVILKDSSIYDASVKVHVKGEDTVYVNCAYDPVKGGYSGGTFTGLSAGDKLVITVTINGQPDTAEIAVTA